MEPCSCCCCSFFSSGTPEVDRSAGSISDFSRFKNQDVLRKTAILFNDEFPHSTVQCLGWIDGNILGTQLPAAVPKFVSRAFGERAIGFFVTTEDGSDPDNRIVANHSVAMATA